MGEQTDAVISDVTIDEYGTIWRGEQIIGDIEPVDDEGSDVSVIAVWDMGALLDALDAVPRAGHRGCHWEEEASRYCGDAAYWRERAECERDALRADNDRLREALQAATDSLSYVLLRCRQMGLDVGRDVSEESWLKPFVGGLKGEHKVLVRTRAALSADADADAEPTQRCPRCRAQIHQNRRWGMRGEVCEDCEEPEPSRAEGDDGRSRAIKAAEKAEPTTYYFTAADGCRTARRRDNREAAEASIDAALASGAVVPAEAVYEAAKRAAGQTRRECMETLREMGSSNA